MLADSNGSFGGEDAASFVASGRSAMSAEVATREVHSLQHLLATARSAQEKAERVADERQAQCEKLQTLIQEADGRRDEQAEAAASATAAAAALRQQLQLQREKVEELREERSKLRDATQLAVERRMEETRLETSASAFILAVELRELEALVSHHEQRQREREQAQRERQQQQAAQQAAASPGVRGGALRPSSVGGGGAGGSSARRPHTPSR